MRARYYQLFLLCLMLTVSALGCGKGEPEKQEVVVYTAFDRELAEPIFSQFTKETGILVRPKFEAEPARTDGLMQAILSEGAQPRCDLFWNNEILNTLRVERQNLLRPFQATGAADLPANAQSPTGAWYGVVEQARVLIVNTNLVSEDRRPKSISDLTDPQWRCGIAKPLFGTTATHAACLFAAWGDAEAKDYFRALKRSAHIMSGNKQVAQAVANGKLDIGITDSGDAVAEIERGMPVAIIYPDQGADQLGTLYIPSTLALLKNSPNPEPAEKLADYLLSAGVEKSLADGPSSLIPLRKEVAASPRVKTPGEIKAMQVDWRAAADSWDTAVKFLQNEFTP